VRTYKGLYYEGTQGVGVEVKKCEAHFSYQEAVERLDDLKKGGKRARQRNRVVTTAESEDETEKRCGGGAAEVIPRMKEST
jgi:hypothetical protein